MANNKCDCHAPVDPNELSTLGFMAHSASKVIAGPVSKGTARALVAYCSTHNCGQSEALRKALTLLASVDGDPAVALKALRELLGLDDTAARDEVVSAVAALFDQAGDSDPSESDGLQEGAEPRPAKLGAAFVQAWAAKLSAEPSGEGPYRLTPEEQAMAGKMTPQQAEKFTALRAERARAARRL